MFTSIIITVLFFIICVSTGACIVIPLFFDGVKMDYGTKLIVFFLSAVLGWALWGIVFVTFAMIYDLVNHVIVS